MARLISEILETEVLNKVNTSLTVTEVEAPTGTPLTQRVKFCSTKWAKLFEYVIIDGNNIAMSDIDDDDYYTLSIGATVPAVTLNTQVDLARPFYFVGTLLNTKLEWARFSHKEDEKLPFIWLVKPTAETFGDQEAGIERNSALELWVVGWSDWTKLNADREDEAIKPLMEYLSAVIKAIEEGPIFEGYDSYTVKDFPKFGVEKPEGTAETYFNTTLSALKINLNLSIFVNNCTNC